MIVISRRWQRARALAVAARAPCVRGARARARGRTPLAASSLALALALAAQNLSTRGAAAADAPPAGPLSRGAGRIDAFPPSARSPDDAASPSPPPLLPHRARAPAPGGVRVALRGRQTARARPACRLPAAAAAARPIETHARPDEGKNEKSLSPSFSYTVGVGQVHAQLGLKL